MKKVFDLDEEREKQMKEWTRRLKRALNKIIERNDVIMLIAVRGDEVDVFGPPEEDMITLLGILESAKLTIERSRAGESA